MNPQEKTKELMTKFKFYVEIHKWERKNETHQDEMSYRPEYMIENAKQCALICVEEILSLRMINNMGRESNDPLSLSEGQYFEQVKEAIKQIK